METLDETKARLLQGFKDYLDSQTYLCQDNVTMMEFLPHLLKLQNDKGKLYGRSYCRHGDISIYFNTERKWDRISNIMERAMKEGTDILYDEESSTATETFVDTVVDLASYGCLWASYIKTEHPAEYAQFVKSNKLNTKGE